MSCNSWTGVTVTTGNEHQCEFAEWAKRHFRKLRPVEDGGRLVVSWEWTYGWFDDNMGELRDMLEDLPIPCGEWEAEVSYRYYDEPEADGSFVDFRIADGKDVDWKESRLVMVGCEPWYEFDFEEETCNL